METFITESEDGNNPIVVVKQENEYEGEQVLQLSRYQAAKLANELVEKVDRLSLLDEEGREEIDYSEELKGAESMKREYDSFSKRNQETEDKE